MKGRHLVPLLALCLSAPAAAVHKCTDADGNVTFSQSACAASDKVTEVKVQQGGGPKPEPFVCEQAATFAKGVAVRMRSNGDYNHELDRYGGTYNAKPAITGVVSYVYSFRLNEEATANRIAGLTHSKCENGGFGRLAVGDLPLDDYYPGHPDNSVPPQEMAFPIAAGAPADGYRQKDCERLEQSLRDVEDRMRSGYSNHEGERLHQAQRNLRRLIDSTCQ